MDIVEQLRRDAYAPHFTSVGAANLMEQAADEIERLRYDLETVRLSLVADAKRIEEILGEAPCDSKKLQPTT